MKYSKELWESLGYLSLTTLITFVFLGMFNDHNLGKYYLGSTNGIPLICLEVDWNPDKTMKIDRSISYDEAIELVNRLNRTLK